MGQKILFRIKYLSRFFLLSSVFIPALIWGQVSGGVRFKPAVVLMPLGSTNSPDIYAKGYSLLLGRIKSFDGINLITNGPVLEGLLQKMPEMAETNSFITIHSKIIPFAYEHFIDEILLIHNGNTSNDFIDIIGRHVDDKNWSWNKNEFTFTEDNLDLQIDCEITNLLTGVDSIQGWRDPKFWNFSGKFHLKDLKTGKIMDLEKYRGKLVVLTEYPAGGFDADLYYLMKVIFDKLNYKFPDIITLFGVYDSSANGKNLKCADVMREKGVLADPEFKYPVVDVTPLPRDRNYSFMAFYYGYLTADGMTNKQFDINTHDRIILGILKTFCHRRNVAGSGQPWSKRPGTTTFPL